MNSSRSFEIKVLGSWTRRINGILIVLSCLDQDVLIRESFHICEDVGRAPDVDDAEADARYDELLRPGESKDGHGRDHRAENSSRVVRTDVEEPSEGKEMEANHEADEGPQEIEALEP